MSDNTNIEWTDASWNPVRAKCSTTDDVGQVLKTGWHCERVSPGCQNCYAETINKRLGTGFDYDAKGIAASDIYLDEKALTQPLHWRRPRRIFVCSMTDLFGEWVTDAMLDRVFAMMAICPQHTFLVLTKRAARMRAYLTNEDRMFVLRSSIEDWLTEEMCPLRWPLPNVHLGASVENQRAADERIPLLLATPAEVRWLSVEPLLGPVDAMRYFGDDGRLHWLVVGGESGPGHRPIEVAWLEDVVRQCRAAAVPVFVKQDSGPRAGRRGRILDELWALKEVP